MVEVAFLLAGLFCIGLSLLYMKRRRAVTEGGIRTRAVVLDYVSAGGSFAYVCEYTAHGEKITARCQTSVGTVNRRKIGRTIWIVYQEENPRKFFLLYDPLLYFFGAVLLAGAGLLATALLHLLNL